MRRSAAAAAPRPARRLPAACVQQPAAAPTCPTRSSGKFGDKPKVTVDEGHQAGEEARARRPRRGRRAEGEKGDLLVADYLGEIYKTSKVFDNSYDRKVPAAFPIGIGSVIPGWDKALVGVKAGSRVLMVVPPKEGYGKKGNAQAGIKGTDSLVFVVDVIASLPQDRHRAEEHRRSPASRPACRRSTGDARRRADHHGPERHHAAEGAQGHRARQGHRPGGGQGQARRSSSTPRSTGPARRSAARGKASRAWPGSAGRPDRRPAGRARSTCWWASRPAAGCC